jgi:hypothetical protein
MLETKPAFAVFSLHLTALQQPVKNGSEQLPGTMLIGITQSGPFRRLVDAQMAQLSLPCGQSTGDLAQTLRVPQLAKQHRDHLRPAGEAARMPLGLMLLYGGFELLPGNQL